MNPLEKFIQLPGKFGVFGIVFRFGDPVTKLSHFPALFGSRGALVPIQIGVIGNGRLLG
jgi:hypothetical protein